MFFKIDGRNRLNDFEKVPFEDEFEKGYTFKVSVKDKTKFTVETKERREYCINEDNFIIFRVNKITKGMNVSICYPKIL